LSRAGPAHGVDGRGVAAARRLWDQEHAACGRPTCNTEMATPPAAAARRLSRHEGALLAYRRGEAGCLCLLAGSAAGKFVAATLTLYTGLVVESGR